MTEHSFTYEQMIAVMRHLTATITPTANGSGSDQVALVGQAVSVSLADPKFARSLYEHGSEAFYQPGMLPRFDCRRNGSLTYLAANGVVYDPNEVCEPSPSTDSQ